MAKAQTVSGRSLARCYSCSRSAVEVALTPPCARPQEAAAAAPEPAAVASKDVKDYKPATPLEEKMQAVIKEKSARLRPPPPRRRRRTCACACARGRG